MSKALLTPAQVADRLQLTEQTVYDWLRSGKIEGVKLGRLWRITEEHLEDFLGALSTRSNGGGDDAAGDTRDAEAWLTAGGEDAARRLAEIEADAPAEEVKAWFDALQRGSQPCRYVPGQGFVLEGDR